MAIIADASNFNTKTIYKVIQAYYYANLALKGEKKQIEWSKNDIMQNSLKLLIPMIEELSERDLILLIKNASLINLKNSELWDELERVFLIKAYKLMAVQDIPKIAYAFHMFERSNSMIWKHLEEAILTQVYPGYEYNPRDISNLIKVFSDCNEGSEELYNKLLQNFKNCVHSANLQDILRVLQAHTKIRGIEKELLTIMLDRVIELKDQLHYKNIGIMTTMSIMLGANLKHIEFFEEEVLKQLPSLHFSQISLIIFNTGRFLDEKIIAQEKMQNFLKTLESFVNKNKEAILGLNNPELNTINQIKYFWGLNKCNILTESEMWKSFKLELLNINENSVKPNLVKYVLHLKELNNQTIG